MTDRIVTTEPIPIINYFVIVLFLVLFVVGITPLPDTEIEKIKEASKIMGVILSIICILFGLIILYTPDENRNFK